jgi:hypothetical protein
VLGQPSVYPAFGDYDTDAAQEQVWSPRLMDSGYEWVELSFAESVVVSAVELYETWYPGSCVKIMLYRNLSSDGHGTANVSELSEWDIVWEGQKQNASAFTAARVFAPPLIPRQYATQHVRIVFNTTGNTDWYELDAVKLIAGISCAACAAGKYKIEPGPSDCVQCVPGKHSMAPAASQAEACLACPPNTYSAGNNSMCVACPASTESLGQSTGVEACICVPGTTGRGGWGLLTGAATVSCIGGCCYAGGSSSGTTTGTISDGVGSYGGNYSCEWIIEATAAPSCGTPVLELDGDAGDYVDVSKSASLDVDGRSFSWAAWVKQSRTSSGPGIFLSQGASPAQKDCAYLSIGYTSDSRFQFQSAQILETSQSFPQDRGQWVHWAGTYEVGSIDTHAGHPIQRVSTVAGNASNSGCQDGASDSAKFNNPWALAVTPDGNSALVADLANHKIRSVCMHSGAVSAWAGSNTNTSEATVTCSGSCSCSPSSGQSSGTITDGPGNYSNGEDCRWLISSTKEIRLSFTSFSTESGYDNVTINRCTSSSCSSAEQIARLSGSVSSSNVYTSSTGYLEVLFTSHSGSAVTCSGSCGCNSSSGQSSGTLTDGSGNYSNNEDCTWLISSPNEIHLSFTSFNTEPGHDNVTIRRCTESSCSGCTEESCSGSATEQIARLSGSVSSSDVYTSSTGYLQVLFTSNPSTMGSGFVATWSTTTRSGFDAKWDLGSGGYQDGNASDALFNSPTDIAITPDGASALIVDRDNNRIRKINMQTRVVTTLAGSGLEGLQDGAGNEAKFKKPTGIAITTGGLRAFVVDQNLIRSIDLITGVVTVLSGSNVVGDQDGASNSARFRNPVKICLSKDGSFALVTDQGNHKIRIINLNDGFVTTLAGKGHAVGPGYADGSEPQFNSPAGIAITSDGGTVIISDTNHPRLRSVNLATGDSDLLAGTGDGTLLENGAATRATFKAAYGLTVTPDGSRLLVADSNHVIRVVGLRGCGNKCVTKKIYRNGKQVAFDYQTAGYSAGGSFRIGMQTPYIRGFTGRLADLMVLTRVLADSEVLMIHRDFELANSNFLVLRFNMRVWNAGAVNVSDVSGNGNDGVISGSVRMVNDSDVLGADCPVGSTVALRIDSFDTAQDDYLKVYSCNSSDCSFTTTVAQVSGTMGSDPFAGNTVLTSPTRFMKVAFQSDVSSSGKAGFDLTWSTFGESECRECAAGFYKESPGSEECTICPAGKFSPRTAEPNSATCANCPKLSTSSPGSRNATDCLCEKGYTGIGGFLLSGLPQTLRTLSIDATVTLSPFPGVVPGKWIQSISGTDGVLLAPNSAALRIGAQSLVDSRYGDGPLVSANWPTQDQSCDQRVFVQLDLGEPFFLFEISRWMDATDDRAWCNQSVDLSVSGAFAGEETVVFSCETYEECGVETSKGKTVFATSKYPVMAQYLRYYGSRSNVSASLRFSEIQVKGLWAFRTGAPRTVSKDAKISLSPLANGNWSHMTRAASGRLDDKVLLPNTHAFQRGVQVLVDGRTTTDEYITGLDVAATCDTQVYVELDLHEPYLVTEISRWLFYADRSSFCNQSVDLSLTGEFAGEEVNIFNCSTHDECGYESQEGRTFEFPPLLARYVRVYSSKSEGADRRNVHFLEVRVTGALEGPYLKPCRECGAGTYKPTMGSEPCFLCPRNTYSMETADVYESDCEPCSNNSHSPMGSNVETNCSCNIGYSASGSGQCVACLAGKYKSINGSAVCIDCPAGQSTAFRCNEILWTESSRSYSTRKMLGGNKWDKCADEGSLCTCSGSARFGYADTGSWVSKEVSGSFNCTTEFFVFDPKPAFSKVCECYMLPAVRSGRLDSEVGWAPADDEQSAFCLGCQWMQIELPAAKNLDGVAVQGSTLWDVCADDGEHCLCPDNTIVRYGAGKDWVETQTHRLPKDPSLEAAGFVCSAVTFGEDPSPGVQKQCECASSWVSAFAIAHSMDGSVWQDIDAILHQTVNKIRFGDYHRALFPIAVQARYVRIFPLEWITAPIMRVGLLERQDVCRVGATNCSVCAAGTYAQGTGTPFCSLCAAGKYLDKTGGTLCAACEPGKYSTKLSAASELTCHFCTTFSNVGSSNVGSAATACTDCSPGKYALPDNIWKLHVSCPALGATQVCKPLNASNRQGHISTGPGQYKNKQRAQWIIDADCHAGAFNFYIDVFDTEECCDKLRLFECATIECPEGGRTLLMPPLAGSSVARAHPYISRNGPIILLVDFRSDDSLTGAGFAASFTVGEPCKGCPPGTYSGSSGMSACVPQLMQVCVAGSNNSLSQLGVDDPSSYEDKWTTVPVLLKGTIAGGPGDYKADTLCKWRLQSTCGDIVFKLEDLDIDGDSEQLKVYQCEAKVFPNDVFTKCADNLPGNSSRCVCPGTARNPGRVRFGNGSNWIERNTLHSIRCNEISFLGDPAPGGTKWCECIQGGDACQNKTELFNSNTTLTDSVVDDADLAPEYRSLTGIMLIEFMSDSDASGAGFEGSWYWDEAASNTGVEHASRWTAIEPVTKVTTKFHALCAECPGGTANPITGRTGVADCIQCKAGTYSEFEVAAAVCANCTATANSPARSDNVTDCICNKGYTGPDGSHCPACIRGTYKTTNGSDACVVCPRNTYSSVLASHSACSKCPNHTSSLNGTSSVADCICNQGFTRDNSEFLALLLSSPPKLASPSTRHAAAVGSTVLPAYNAQGGPWGKGHVSFDRTQTQYLDGGARTFKIASNGGFTVVAVVRFRGSPAYWERIIEFGNGPDDNNILLARKATSSDLSFETFEGSSYMCRLNAVSAIVQDQWMTIVARYRAHDRTCTLVVNGQLEVSTTGVALTDKTLTNTWVGRNLYNQGWLNADIAGLYVKDEYASDEKAALIANALEEGLDLTEVPACKECAAGTYKPVNGSSPCTLCPRHTYSTTSRQISASACLQCPNHTSAPQGSNNITDCICNAGYTGPGGHGPPNRACTACPPGFYKSVNGTAECVACSPGTSSEDFALTTDCPYHCAMGSYSTGGASTCTWCELGKYTNASGSSACLDCEAGKYGVNAVTINESLCQSSIAGTYTYYQEWQGRQAFALANKSKFFYSLPAQSRWFIGPTLGSTTADAYVDSSAADALKINQTWKEWCGTTPTWESSSLSVGRPESGKNETCLDCAAGTYADLAGLSACKQCAYGKISLDAATECLRGETTCTTGSSANHGKCAAHVTCHGSCCGLTGFEQVRLALRANSLVGISPGRPISRWDQFNQSVLPSQPTLLSYGTNQAVGFRRQSSQFLDGGSMTLAFSGGMTVIARFKMTGNANSDERIFDFAKGEGNDNVMLTRNGSSSRLEFSIRNSNQTVCTIVVDDVLVQEEWMTIAVRYNDALNKVDMLKNGTALADVSCSSTPANRDVSKSYVGKSNWASDPTTSMDLAGLLIIEDYLNNDEVIAAGRQLEQGGVSSATTKGVLSDGTGSYNNFETCRWLIAIEGNDECVRAPITLTFNELDTVSRAYREYALKIVETRNSGENCGGFAELRFYDSTGKRLFPSAWSNPGGDNINSGHTEASAFDGDVDTKWLDRNKQLLIATFNTNVQVASYEWISANDAANYPGRNPVSWLLQARSLSSDRWEVLSRVVKYSVNESNNALVGPFSVFAYSIYDSTYALMSG